MNRFVKFMPTPFGRTIRVVGGALLIAAGLVAVGGMPGAVVAALGVVPLATGLFDLCLFGPLFRLPVSGAQIRAMR
jgi:hypothetical protein